MLKTPKQVAMEIARAIDQTTDNIVAAGSGLFASTGLPMPPLPPRPPRLEGVLIGIPELPVAPTRMAPPNPAHPRILKERVALI